MRSAVSRAGNRFLISRADSVYDLQEIPNLEGVTDRDLNSVSMLPGNEMLLMS